MARGTPAGRRWRDRRLVSWTLRALAFLAPLAAAFGAVWLFTRLVDRPTSLLPQLGFWVAVVAVAVVAGLAMDRVSRRLLPLAALFRMSLPFPGQAPNRLAVAFGSGASTSTAGLSPDDQAARHLLSLVRVLTRHDPRTRGHSERVWSYAEMIGEEMELGPDDLDRVRWGALIHDVGKLSVPPEILGGGDRPSTDEWDALRDHSIASEPYLYGVAEWLGSGALAAVQHHERWDGRGYPDGLAGEEISLAARVVAVADAYDAMTATRSYREPLRPSMAREQVARNAGAQFDPAVVRAFLDLPGWRLRLVLGPIGWLTEFLWFTRLPHAAAGVAATAGVAAVVGVGTAALFASSVDADDRVTAGGGDVDVPVTTTTTTTTTTTAAPTTTTTAAPATTTPTTTSIVLTTTTTSTTTTTVAPTPTTTAPPATTTTAAPTTTTTAAPTTTTSTTTTAPATTTTVPPTPPVATGTGFVDTDPASLPAALGDGALTSDTDVFLVSEGLAVTTTPLELRSFVDGVTFDATAPTTTLAGGTQVCTYLVHADPIAATAYVAELDFGVVPLGFAMTTDDLTDTDEFETDGVDHQYDGLEPLDDITVDGTVITLEWDATDPTRDQLRIFLSC